VDFVEVFQFGGKAGMILGGIVRAGEIINIRLHLFPDGFVDGLMAGVFLDGFVAILAILLIGEWGAVFFFFGARIADEDEFVGDKFFPAELVDRGNKLELGEVAAGAEDDNCAGDGCWHMHVSLACKVKDDKRRKSIFATDLNQIHADKT